MIREEDSKDFTILIKITESFLSLWLVQGVLIRLAEVILL